MPSNVIAFAARTTSHSRHAARPPATPRANVIELANWIGRAIPRRTPNGVFFTTQVLTTPGEIA